MRLLVAKMALMLSFISLQANDCPDEFSSKLFFQTSEYFNELMEQNFKKEEMFQKHSHYKKLNFIQGEDGYWYKKDSFITKGDYKYPTVDGMWAYHVDKKTDEVDEVKVALRYLYKMGTRNFADEIIDDYGEFWRDYEGDASENTLIPDNAKINYKGQYMTMRVQLYGTLNDSTKLPTSVANFWLYNYNKEVKSYKDCISK